MLNGMWDVLTWHDGRLAIAWRAVIVLVIALLSVGGAAAAGGNNPPAGCRTRRARIARSGRRERAVLRGL
jgi:hypothetical protein